MLLWQFEQSWCLMSLNRSPGSLGKHYWQFMHELQDESGTGPGSPGPIAAMYLWREHHMIHPQIEHLCWHPVKRGHKLRKYLEVRQHNTGIPLQVYRGRHSILLSQPLNPKCPGTILYNSLGDSGAPINSKNRGWCNCIPYAGLESATAGPVNDVIVSPVRMYYGGYYGLVVVTPRPQTFHRSHDNLKNPYRIASIFYM